MPKLLDYTGCNYVMRLRPSITEVEQEKEQLDVKNWFQKKKT